MKKLNCVLLIDDSEPTNYVNKKIVTKANITEKIVAVESGFEALDYLKTRTNEADIPELIFLDINMPGMSGWEFLTEYEKLPKNDKALVVVVMLTTSLNPSDRTKAVRLGYVGDFIIKPLNLEKVEEIYEAFFKNRK
ncbi:MAG: response regulator [Flavobacteriaceae bacterium]|nr:response regulator [Flavobacteriaceae bacterium]|tara:strand:+ start:468864 stop:469274 length:411 start_codon:yes stop_codon:yes gene_type:complete